MEIVDLKKEFEKIYGNGESALFFSPGRVNLIGEHTDYNGGYVFPCALTFGSYLVIRKNDKSVVRFASLNFDFKTEIGLDKLEEKVSDGAWVNYPLGVMQQFARKGVAFVGMDLLFYGNIPNGAGLSSSASIELATAVALNDLYNCNLEMMEMVKLGQRAENQFVGVNCGIMDQFAVGMGKKDHALALKCDTLKWEAVPLTLGNYRIVIANTNKRRGLADSKYNERRTECDKAVEYISKVKPIKFLGDINLADFEELKNAIPEEVVMRRARHVVSENQRVVDAIPALQAGDLVKFGQLMNGSHDSLRDDYEVTGVELDALVEEARKIDGVIGSRMTGAGFGGCTVSLVDVNSVDTFIAEVGKNYKARTGLTPDFYVAEVGNGAGRIN
ncbi:MAG: galactokinase [Bacteroidota bacterium]|nr:galactokinase [Bacteroidota bacterium]MDP4206036.1 galactokinase [Bacteroidota bacterium]